MALINQVLSTLDWTSVVSGPVYESSTITSQIHPIQIAIDTVLPSTNVSGFPVTAGTPYNYSLGGSENLYVRAEVPDTVIILNI